MYAVEAEEDCLSGEFQCDCSRMKAAYSRGMLSIEIHNERANQMLAKIKEAALEQCPQCGGDREHKAPCLCYQRDQEKLNNLALQSKLLVKLLPILSDEELRIKLPLISRLCQKCGRN